MVRITDQFTCAGLVGGGWVGVHKGTVKPMGRLANEELRYWKKKAHAAFDPIWQAKVNQGWRKIRARSKTYEWLAKEMKLPLEHTHIPT